MAAALCVLSHYDVASLQYFTDRPAFVTCLTRKERQQHRFATASLRVNITRM